LWGIPAVIFGAGKTGKLVVDRLLDNLKIGYIPVLLLDDNPLLAGEYRGVPIVTGTNYGSFIASSGEVQTAIIAMPGVEHKRLTEIIVRQAMGFRRYLIIPDVIGISSLWMAVQDLNGILGLFTDQELLEPRNIAIKRLLDIVLSVIGMILLSPFFIVIALLIKLDSPGPIFYSHHRLGKNGKPIEILKFRSMYTNSAQMLETLLRDNPELQTEWQANFKLKNDPRITRVGAFLRRTSLDELPQLWNILKGDLSLVGPRPIIDNEVEKYGDNYWLLSKVKPGLSGLWQVSGRSETDYEQRVALDVYYIQSWSLWLDLYILLKTIVVVLKGDGAY
jgi:Undecaprenyl-phosphate galactose phosphotransferase WbaP